MRYRKVAIDAFLNIVSTAIPTFVLQLMILPAIANHMSDDQYGLLVTILALLNVVSATLGNAINNVRLISNNSSEKSTKNYNLILIVLSFVNFFVVAGFDIFYEGNITPLNLLLTILASVIWLAHEYYIVAFRIKIDYVKMLICNIVLVAGYGIGYGLFLIVGYWQIIYIFGRLLSLLYICYRSSLWKESFSKDERFAYLLKETGLLSGSNILTRITTYADKLLIFPILGGATVSIYYAATLFGKVVSIAIMPISSVMLTYLSKLDKKNDNLFRTTTLWGGVICAIGYVICLLITEPVLSILYPRFVKDAMEYIPITTATMVITSLITMINPFVLKFFSMKWQVIINAVYVMIYIIVSMTMLHFWGLFGFCVGSLVATCCKLIILFIIYYKIKPNS